MGLLVVTRWVQQGGEVDGVDDVMTNGGCGEDGMVHAPSPRKHKRVRDEAVCLTAKLTNTNHLFAVHSNFSGIYNNQTLTLLHLNT